jgi:hypothetical protein
MKNPPPATTLEKDSRPTVSKKTHCGLILSYLQQGYTLTPLEALQKFNCFALSQRVTDLRQAGHRIVTKMIKLPSGKRVAEYKLEQQ